MPEEYDGSVYSAAALVQRSDLTKLSAALRSRDSGQHDGVDAVMREMITAKTAHVAACLIVFVMICVLLLVAAGALINLFNLAIHFPGLR